MTDPGRHAAIGAVERALADFLSPWATAEAPGGNGGALARQLHAAAVVAVNTCEAVRPHDPPNPVHLLDPDGGLD